jgi:hypothetical protein
VMMLVRVMASSRLALSTMMATIVDDDGDDCRR